MNASEIYAKNIRMTEDGGAFASVCVQLEEPDGYYDVRLPINKVYDRRQGAARIQTHDNPAA